MMLPKAFTVLINVKSTKVSALLDKSLKRFERFNFRTCSYERGAKLTLRSIRWI